MKTLIKQVLMRTALACGVIAIAASTHAAQRTWTGGGLDNNWNTALNWDTGVPVNGDSVVFSGSTRRLNTNNIVGLTLSGLGYSSSAFCTTNGSAITLTGGIFATAGSNTNLVALTLSGAQAFTNDAAATVLLLGGSITNAGNKLSVGGAGSVWLNGIITGAGGLAVQGAGTNRLAGANVFNGSIDVQGGVLQIANAAAIPSGAGRGDMTNNALVDVNGNNQTYNGIYGSGMFDVTTGGTGIYVQTIGANATNSAGNFTGTIQNTTGKLGLTKNNTNYFTFNGNGTYTGPTTINSGQFILGAAAVLSGTTPITVTPGAVFDVTAQPSGFPLGASQTLVAGRTTNGGPYDIAGSVSSAGKIAPYKIGLPGTMTISNGLALSGGFLDFDLGNSTTAGAGSNDLIIINGALALSGTTTLRVNPIVSALGVGNYMIISNRTATVTGDTNNLAVIAPRGVTAVFDTTTAPGSVLMAVSGTVGSVSLGWRGTNGSPIWDVNTTPSWANGAVADNFQFLDSVLFDDNGVGAVTLDVAVNPGSTTFNNALTNYSIGLSGLNFGNISGTGSLTMNGPGQVVMNTANSYTGNTIVNRGTLVLAGYDTGTFGANTVVYNSVTTADLEIGGGGVFLQGVANSTHSDIFRNLVLKPGGSSFSMRNRQANETTYNCQFGNWSRAVGSSIDFNNIQNNISGATWRPCGVYMTNTATANSILGGWATIYEENWIVPLAFVSPGTQTPGLTNFLAYQTVATPALWIATSNISLSANASVVADTEINSLKLSNSVVTINAGSTLKLTTGGLLMGTVATGAGAINGGMLKGATSADLIVHNHSFNQSLTIGASIVDNVGATALTKAGQGKLILTGTNSYSGTTYIGGAILNGGAGSLPGILGTGTLQIGAGGTVGDLGLSTVVTNYGILAVNRSDSFTYGGTISGPGAFQQIGAGTTVLTGNNSFSGTTTISAGVLQVGLGGTTGTLGSSSNVVNNTSLVFSRSDGVTVNGPISGLGLLTQQGAGILTLNTNETFSGGIRVNAGGIVLGSNASISNAASVTMALNTTLTAPSSGLTLNPAVSQFISGRGAITGAVNCVTGTRISPGTNGTTFTFTVAGNLVMNGGTINFDFNAGASSKDLLIVSTNLTLNGGVIGLNIFNGTLANGTYKLIQYGGTLTGTNLSFNGFLQSGQQADLSFSTPGEIDLIVSTYVSQNLVWQGDGGANLWNQLALNWTNASGLLTNYYDFDNVKFDDSSANTTVNLVGDLTPSLINIPASVNNYTLQGGGELASGFINKTGPATLTVLTTNTSASAINLAAGTIQLGNGTANGTLGVGNLTNNATLVFNEGGSQLIASPMFGGGLVSKQGVDVVQLTGNNGGFTGPIDLTSGALAVGIGAGIGTLGTGAVTNNSLLIFNRSGSLSYSGGIYGAGVVSNSGPGVVTLGGSNSFGNLYVVNGTVKAAANEVVPDTANNGSTGWLIIDGAASVAGTFDLNGFNETVNALSGLNGTVLGKVVNDGGTVTNRLNFINNGVTNSFSGRILDNNGAGGKVSLLMSGSGQQQLNVINSGGNPFTGGTVISNGVLAITTPYLGGGVLQQPNANSLGLGSGPITICGGVLALNWDNNATPTYGSIGNPITIPANCTGTIMPSPRGSFSPVVSGSGTLVYAANFVRCDFNADMSAFTGSVVISNNPAGGNAGNDFRVLTAGGIPISPVNLLSNVNMAGMTAPAGGIPLGELSGTNCFIGTSSGSVGTTWRVGGLNTSTNFGGNIGNANAILKDGTGSWTLAGVNTYSGVTSVTNGALILDADAAASPSTTSYDLRSTNAVLDVSRLTAGTLTLGAAQSLVGNGTIRGSVNASSSVIPGSGLGKLTVTNAITFGGTAAIAMDLNRTNTGATNDVISAVSVTSGGTLTVANLGPVLHTGDKFKLFTVPVTGPFATVTLPVSGFDPNTNLITYVWTNKLEIDGTVEVLSGYVPPVLTSSNANLASLIITPAGTLAPTFDSNVVSYLATNAYANSPITVTPTSVDTNATIQVIYGGVTNTVLSGAASGPLTLNASPLVSNPVEVHVTAQDAVTVKSYTVTVTRQPSLTQPTLSRSVGGGNLTLSWPTDHAGWSLQTQTNTRAIGLRTNWFDLAGSTATNQVVIPVGISEPTVFFRLFYLAP